MKILFVTPRLPVPADTGAKIRTFNLLKNVAEINDVTLLSFYFEDDARAVDKIKNLVIEVYLVKAKGHIQPAKIFSNLPISIEKYRSEELAKKLQELLCNKKFDLVHFDHLHMGQYWHCVNGLPAVLDEHNVESEILNRCADIEPSLAKRIIFKSQAKKMKRFEEELVSKFTKCLAVSDIDKQKLLEISHHTADVEVIPNGVDTEFFDPRPMTYDLNAEDSLVFTGSMDWLPNIDAVEYFCKDILPLVWKKKLEVKFYVVGKNPPAEIRMFGRIDKRIIITGSVEDVRPYLAKSKVFVVPLQIGGGTRLKILEAMAMEKAVVSTRIGAEGIAYTEGKDIILGDSPQDFADAVLTLLEDNQKRDELGKAGRDLVCRNYDWKIIGEKLNQVYRMVVANDRER